MSAWYEDDKFWAESFAHEFKPEKFIEAEQELNAVLSLTRFDGQDILDVGCGPGRHVVGLAQRDFDVTGIDLSKFMIEAAREYASDNHVTPVFRRQDMKALDETAHYDLALCLFTTIGYFENSDDDLLTLTNIYKALRPGGQFVLETASKESIARQGPYDVTTKALDGSKMHYHSEVIDDFDTMENLWTLKRKKQEPLELRSRLRLYAGSEMKALFAGAGFENIVLYGDWDGRPYGSELVRLICIGEKL